MRTIFALKLLLFVVMIFVLSACGCVEARLTTPDEPLAPPEETVVGVEAVVIPEPAKVVPKIVTEEKQIPGAVGQEWVAPMYDTIRVPGSIAPDGVSYRPSHQTVVEIRPGRYQEVQYPEEQETEQREFDYESDR